MTRGNMVETLLTISARGAVIPPFFDKSTSKKKGAADMIDDPSLGYVWNMGCVSGGDPPRMCPKSVLIIDNQR